MMKNKKFSVILITFLLTLILLIFLPLPDINKTMHKQMCKGNLSQISICINHLLRSGRPLPLYVKRTASGVEEIWSWRAAFVEQNDLQKKYGLLLYEPWNSPHNADILAKDYEISNYLKCPCDQGDFSRSPYVAVKGPGTFWTEYENHAIEFRREYADMIIVIETTEPKKYWAEPGDDVTPEEVERLFLADPGLVKNSHEKCAMLSFSHWPKHFICVDGSTHSFGEIKTVEELRRRLIIPVDERKDEP